MGRMKGPKSPTQPAILRRKFLTAGAASALLGSAEAQETDTSASISPLSALAQLPLLRSYHPQRSSSYDRSGGNADFVRLDPGQTKTLLAASGPGIVTHIWITIASREEYHLKKLVLRAFWDDENTPSVEVPAGDFFGLMLGDYFVYQSALTSVASIKALNAYFPMPFQKSARITMSNEGSQRVDSLYYNIDYVSLNQMPSNMAYFHAQYRQAAPCPKVNSASGKNLTGEDNYVFLEAQGRGHFIGVTHGVLQNQEGWWGEGDEMIFIDGSHSPQINGTGSEDYYNGAWDFGGINGALPFSYLHNGAPYIVNAERIGGRYCLYRWHIESPIPFERSIRVTIEHGHANNRSDNFYSTAFWYQTEPHMPFPALPPVAERIPRVVSVGGPGAVKT